MQTIELKKTDISKILNALAEFRINNKINKADYKRIFNKFWIKLK